MTTGVLARGVSAGLLITLVLPMLPAPAGAVVATQTLFVAPGGTDGADSCTAAADPCATIGHALARSGAGAVIDVAAGTYREHGLVVAAAIVIDGAGPGRTVIDAQGKGQAMLVSSGASLTLHGLTISHGRSSAHAGAIENSGTLALVDDRLVGNSAADPGGAVVNYATITAIDHVAFVGNSTQTYGGALTNFGTIASASGDVFQGNFAQEGAGAVDNEGSLTELDGASFTANRAGYAGAVDNGGTIGDLSGDTFWANEVFGYGGALVNVFGVIGTVSDDTFVGNSVDDGLGQGGAIEQDQATITLLADDTITDNRATIGGGIDNEDQSVVSAVTGVVIARNSGTEGADCDNFMARFVDAGHNLESDTGAGCGFDAAHHDLVGVQPQLRGLGAYGGATLTEAPLPGSPVVGAGPTICPTAGDERGVPRPQGPAGTCDIGAVELAFPRPTGLAPATGPAHGGTDVRVTGHGFTLSTRVAVGTTPVRFRVVSDSLLTFLTPPGHGRAAVTITDPDGTSVAALGFSYGPQGA